jgi:hypothetical protein
MLKPDFQYIWQGLYLKGTITGRSKNWRLRAHNRFVDPEFVSLTHKFQVAVLLGAHELG